jgi:hypothetical protein
MPISLRVSLEWIKEAAGGREMPPVVGLRPTIRWQRYIEAWLESAFDVEITSIESSPENGCNTVGLRFSERAQLDSEWLREGELIELLDAFRVIGVGKILHISDG